MKLPELLVPGVKLNLSPVTSALELDAYANGSLQKFPTIGLPHHSTEKAGALQSAERQAQALTFLLRPSTQRVRLGERLSS